MGGEQVEQEERGVVGIGRWPGAEHAGDQPGTVAGEQGLNPGGGGHLAGEHGGDGGGRPGLERGTGHRLDK